MENNNEVIMETETEVIENNDVIESTGSNNEFLDVAKRLGIAFGCGMVGAAGAAVVNVFVMPKLVKAIEDKKASKGTKKPKKEKKEKPEHHTEEKENKNPYSSKMRKSFNEEEVA